MAEVNSIKARIAALNLEQVHAPEPTSRPAYSYEQASAKKKPPPPPPSQRPSAYQRQQTVNNPPIHTNGTTSTRDIGNQPVAPTPGTPKIQPALPPRPPPRTSSSQQPPGLPPRTTSGGPSPNLPPRTTSGGPSPNLPPRTTLGGPSPSLPPRRSSENHSIRRQPSNESVSTIASGMSGRSIGTSISRTSDGGSLYKIRAPEYDPSKLPPLPPKKEPEDNKQSATLKAMKSKSHLVVTNKTLPPQLPIRPPLPTRKTSPAQENVQVDRPRVIAPPPRRSALEFGMNKATETPPPLPASRPEADATLDSAAPPPIPLSSRPNLEAIMTSKPKPGATGFCLKCRDFSAPDHHAAQYPRQNLPSSDVGWLAHQLCSPFPSATDKARVIFTWLHHNVEYDCHSFFSGTVSGSTPEKTITSGLAVCEGYASLFSALALKAGLEAIVVGGHGKGYGHNSLKPGDPVPNCKPSGHAWNAVRIDHGEWKLIDCCWGAGNVNGPSQAYEKNFKAYWFTMDNNEFGTKHFPENNNYFFRTDGRASISWQEYMMDDMGERLMVYGPATPDHGLGERTFQPTAKHIQVNDPSNPVIRFQFGVICQHWDNERHGKGKPYPMVLHAGGRDGRKTDWIPFNTDNKVWWVDVNRNELGVPGQKVSVFAVTSIAGKDGRGVTMEEYKSKKGKVAMGFGGVAMWELV